MQMILHAFLFLFWVLFVRFTDLRTTDTALRRTTRTYPLGSTCWKLQTSEWMFSRAERMLGNSSCWRGSCLDNFGCPFLLVFCVLFFLKGPPEPVRRCDPGKVIFWLPVAASISLTRFAHSSFSLALSLLEILPHSPGMDVPPETSKHVKKTTSQKLEDQKKVRWMVHSEAHLRFLL